MEANEIISSGLLELYASGLASGEESSLVEQYVIRYPGVAEELTKIEAALETYATAYGAKPDDSVKDKIFERLNEKPQISPIIAFTGAFQNQLAPKAIGIPPYWKYVAAAAVILLAGSIFINILINNKREEVNKNYLETQQQLALLQKDHQELQGNMQVVQNKYSKPVLLNGLEAAPGAVAKIFWIANTGELYIDPSNLPDAPEGKQYQLWGIVDGKPVDAGIILSPENGGKYRIQKMKSFGRAEAFAVTLESGKGNKTPKGPMFVMGKM